MRIDRAVDTYIGELARRGRSKSTRDTYHRLLIDFATKMGHRTVAEVTADDCRSFLDRWTDAFAVDARKRRQPLARLL